MPLTDDDKLWISLQLETVETKLITALQLRAERLQRDQITEVLTRIKNALADEERA